MLRKLRRFVAVWTVALMAAITSADCQEAITLKLAHSLPATHYLWAQGMQKFAESVTANTGGKVQFQVYPAGQLGKDYYGLLQSGLADVAMVIPQYAPDKFPRTSVTELPGYYSSACDGTAKFWNMAKPGAILARKEYEPRGLHVLFVNTLTPYDFMTASKKVDSLDSASGLKMWANGSALDKTVRALGAIPVRITGAELFDAITRGTVDGAVFPFSSITQYKLAGKILHSAEGVKLGSGSWVLAMTDKRWNALSEDVRKVMTEAGVAAQKQLCAWEDTDAEITRKQLMTQNGLTTTMLSSDQVKLWRQRLDGVGADWAKEMDSAGREGTELLEAMRKADATQ